MSKHYAIKCTNCAAPLDILGGGRVNTVTCSYCHSVLDMNDHYKVLAKFNNMKHPEGPFKIGMRGNIKGVEWTIIGWIHYKTGEFPSEEWDEFFLYSPTHGYAWLVHENNKLYFSKRVRDFDLLAWQEKKPKTLFYHKGHYLQKESAYLTYVEYVEGELNWVAKFGDKFMTWDYDGVGFKTLNIEKTGEEIEVYHTEHLDKADIYSAFGLKENYEKSSNKQEEEDSVILYEDEIEDKPSYKGYIFLFFILLFTILFSYFTTQKVESFTMTEQNNTQLFKLNSDSFLTHISIVSPNGLGKSSLYLYKGQEKILSIENNNIHTFYKNNALLYRWSSTAIYTDIYLKLNKGTYTLIYKQNKPAYKLIIIEKNFLRLKYILPLFILITLIIFRLYKNYFNWKYIMVILILIIVILGYIYGNIEFILFLLFIAFVIYIGSRNSNSNNYSKKRKYYNDDDWDDGDD